MFNIQRNRVNRKCWLILIPSLLSLSAFCVVTIRCVWFFSQTSLNEISFIRMSTILTKSKMSKWIDFLYWCNCIIKNYIMKRNNALLSILLIFGSVKVFICITLFILLQRRNSYSFNRYPWKFFFYLGDNDIYLTFIQSTLSCKKYLKDSRYWITKKKCYTRLKHLLLEYNIYIKYIFDKNTVCYT